MTFVPKEPTSRRCSECQMRPQPADMELFFGKDWRTQSVCTRCRGDILAGNIMLNPPRVEVTVPVLPRQPQYAPKAFLAPAPKICGLSPDKIKDWFVPAPLRIAAREKNFSMERGRSYEVYITDGRRFWTYSDFLRQPSVFIDWDTFNDRHKAWTVLPDNERHTTGFSHIKV